MRGAAPAHARRTTSVEARASASANVAAVSRADPAGLGADVAAFESTSAKRRRSVPAGVGDQATASETGGLVLQSMGAEGLGREDFEAWVPGRMWGGVSPVPVSTWQG